ncbi:toxin-activating lysine-acyltransferase [Avibacterium avium]|uniref:toxin-activating lysine-acyltransferase n=1 Tax=Avibacterium avium TaxID=751 RepID=UPI0039FD0591
MRFDNDISVVAPSVFTEKYSEAEVLGAITWLWGKSDYYKTISIESMLDLVLKIIKSKQFALFSHKGKPIGYLVWAFMTEQDEADYLQSGGMIDAFIGHNNGSKLWILSIHCPADYFSKRKIVSLSRSYLFPNKDVYSLYHRGKEKGFKIMKLQTAKPTPIYSSQTKL